MPRTLLGMTVIIQSGSCRKWGSSRDRSTDLEGSVLLGEGCVEGDEADKMQVLAVETRSCAGGKLRGNDAAPGWGLGIAIGNTRGRDTLFVWLVIRVRWKPEADSQMMFQISLLWKMDGKAELGSDNGRDDRKFSLIARDSTWWLRRSSPVLWLRAKCKDSALCTCPPVTNPKSISWCQSTRPNNYEDK